MFHVYMYVGKLACAYVNSGPLIHSSGTAYTVDSRYLEVKGTLKNTSKYPYFDISDVQN